jgi:hypothetical protein
MDLWQWHWSSSRTGPIVWQVSAKGTVVAELGCGHWLGAQRSLAVTSQRHRSMLHTLFAAETCVILPTKVYLRSDFPELLFFG